MPLGACIARKSIMTWPNGSHGNTYGIDIVMRFYRLLYYSLIILLLLFLLLL
jgi:hypothetical protein